MWGADVNAHAARHGEYDACVGGGRVFVDVFWVHSVLCERDQGCGAQVWELRGAVGDVASEWEDRGAYACLIRFGSGGAPWGGVVFLCARLFIGR